MSVRWCMLLPPRRNKDIYVYKTEYNLNIKNCGSCNIGGCRPMGPNAKQWPVCNFFLLGLSLYSTDPLGPFHISVHQWIHILLGHAYSKFEVMPVQCGHIANYLQLVGLLLTWDWSYYCMAPCKFHYYAPPLIGGGIKRCFCLTSICRVHRVQLQLENREAQQD